MKNTKTTWAAVLTAIASAITGVVLPLLNDTIPTGEQMATAFGLMVTALGLFFAKDSTPNTPEE